MQQVICVGCGYPRAPWAVCDKCNIQVRNTYPEYLPTDSLEERVAKCIALELYHGGNSKAAAKAILRDVKAGYIKFGLEEG